MKSIINNITGQLICATSIEVKILENEMLIDELLTEPFDNPYFDFETKTFYNKIDE